MSLTPIKDKTELETKEISIVGTKEDMQALGAVLSQSRDMLNIDLDTRSKDMPERLSFKDIETIDALAYPRTARVLRKLGKHLKDVKDDVDIKTFFSANFGNMEWLAQKPENNFMIVKALQSVLKGTPVRGVPPLPIGLANIGSITMDLENMIQRPYPSNMVYGANNMGLFHNFVKPEWVKIQTIDVSPIKSQRFKALMKKRREAESERLKGNAAYPPDLTKIDNKKEATQGYYAALRGEVYYDMQQRIKVDKDAWRNFMRKLPSGLLANEMKRRPKTVGDLFETLMAVNVGLVMNMKDATVRPYSPERPKVEARVYDWIPTPPPGKPPAKRPETGILYSTIVVGTGPFPGIGTWGYDVSTINRVREIPGWF